MNGEKPLPPAPLELDTSERHVRIHKLKRRLQAWPNDALAQTDLAREYTILGQRLKAIRPVTTALALAPNSPFVVRSAARFFLNDGDHDRALSVVRRAPNLSGDPWLLSAEVAIADAAGRVTRFGNLLSEARKKIELLRTREAAVAARLLEIVSG